MYWSASATLWITSSCRIVVMESSKLAVRRAANLSQPQHALQISGFVGRPPRTLRFPHRLGEAFDDAMLGFVLRAQPCRDGLKCLADAGRAVGCDLIAHGEVQAHVQERIRLSAFRRVVAVERVVAAFQRRVI